MATYRNAPKFGKPVPSHAQTESAEAARVVVRRSRASRAAAVPLVTSHVPPWRRVDVAELPSAAASFGRAAERAGHEVAARAAGKAVQVGFRELDRNALMIRATWVRGRMTVAALRGAKVPAAEARAAFGVVATVESRP
jgi:hypothetical protein